MNFASILTITRKELRTYFLSPVAFLFLGAYLTITLFLFFTYSKFFARNLADITPLFEWLPVMLIFLVSALTMRQWSDEKKMGTLEVLMTLPVRTSELVVGKFLAGLVLVALALMLTLPLPLTTGYLGTLDWGPVIGGYVAGMLLASTYLAVGLCVSARTDNQIVALMVSTLICSLLYMVGSDAVVGLFGQAGGELLQQFGTGSRFASIGRGVLDIRDLTYYGTLTLFFLLVNVQFIEAHRLEKEPGTAGGERRRALALTVLLAGLNVIAANVWLKPVTSLRADLTENGEYTVSASTKRILKSLDEPLMITGYFSAKTHPLLAPLVPRIRNLLEEYRIYGGSNISVSTIDPNADEEIEKEIQELYNIKSFPFRVASRHERSVVNSYFHVLVRYGDEHLVLGFDDLIEVFADDTDVQVRLKNLEYDLTRAIKKVSQGFQSIEAVLARSKTPVKLTGYITTADLPEEYKEVPARVEKVAKELAEKSGGKFVFEVVDPSGDDALKQKLYRDFGFRPMAVGLFSNKTFYLHLLFQNGEHMERIFPQGELTEAALRTAIEASIKRSTPGFLKTVALLTKDPAPPQQMPFGQPPPPARDFQILERSFAEEYEFRRVDLKDGVVPGDVDVLIVAKPGNLTDKQKFAVDQYLMRGGAVVAMASAYDVDQRVKSTKADKGLIELLKAYGVTVEDALVMDPMNASFPIPRQVQRGPFTFEQVDLLPYPYFPDIRKEGFDEDHLALRGVPNVAVTWASPVKLADELEGRESSVLLKTSPRSWTVGTPDLQPNFSTYPKSGFMLEGEDPNRIPVAVSVAGTFPSHFADKPSPLFTESEEAEDEESEGDEAGEDPEEEKKEADRTGRTLKASTPDARLVVIGSSSLASDMIAGMDFRSGTDSFAGNLMLMKNLVDWAVADTDLLEIRSAGKFARTLRPMTAKERTTYEWMNYGVVLLALAFVGGMALNRRRMAVPLNLN